jgi:hypothetical protein
VNDTDLTKLCRYVAALSPAQQWDEYTVDAWADVLPRDFTLDECRAAVIEVKRRQPWVDPSSIIDQVRRARRPAEEAAHLATVLDPDAYRAQIEADDAQTEAVLARIRSRAGLPPQAQLKAIPPPGTS